MANQPSLGAPQKGAPENPQLEQNLSPEPSKGQPAVARNAIWRTHLALAFVVIAALFSLVQGFRYFQPRLFLSFFQQDTPLPSDFVARNERMLSCIFSELPAGETIGFMTDMEGSAHNERYRITQYVLAPTLVDDSTDHPFIIGIFSAPYDPRPPDPQQFTPLVDCGTGIFLLQNNSNP